MTNRIDVLKTYKLFIDGKFPRSESGRTTLVQDAKGRGLAHVARASRKDLRDAVEAARKAQPGWAGATAYNRGPVLYRMAEMMEGKRDELESAILAAGGAAKKAAAAAEVSTSIDRMICFAGWADKYSQVLGCNNPVAGPYYNFTVPEATGVVGIIAPIRPTLLGLVSLLAPVICSGNATVLLASEANPIPGAIFGEIGATSDVPGGVINILTGERAELIPQFAAHREIDAIHATAQNSPEARTLREGVAENLKRVVVRDVASEAAWFDAATWHAPRMIEPFVEMKTIWHPAAV